MNAAHDRARTHPLAVARVLLSMALIALLLSLPLVASAAEPAKPSPWAEPEAAAIAKLTDELRAQLSTAFTIVHVGPWVIATDTPKEQVARLTTDLIGTYAAQIQRQLFTTPRSSPVKVLLFKDKDSYEAWNQKLYGEKADTPYGYYSRTKNALVMNIGTGGGTLLHEMTHAMAEADFPDIPAWLNEGLGSLYEASSLRRDGRVAGIANWRLEGLIERLDAGTAPAYADLLVISDADFYGKDAKDGNYAAARYLMQWLQDQGKLDDFYTRIRTGEPGPAALCAAVGKDATIAAIQSRVYAWARTLTVKK